MDVGEKPGGSLFLAHPVYVSTASKRPSRPMSSFGLYSKRRRTILIKTTVLQPTIISQRTVRQTDVGLTERLDQLPLELLDIVLEKSFVHWIAISSPENRNEDVVKALASVEFCWFQRMTRRRVKRRILHRLKVLVLILDFYERTRKPSAIIRNNRNYLIENIHPTNELVTSLLSLNCITEEQSDFIQRQRSNREKNAELLYVIRSFDDAKISSFVSYLRQSNQNTVAKIIENGGGVIKLKVAHRGARCIGLMSMDTQKLHEKLEDLRNRTKPRSHQTDKLISQLKKQGIEILNSQLDRQTVVVWIWCRSQSALEHIQKLYESNKLKDVFQGLADIQPSTSKISQSKLLIIDSNQFETTVVVCSTSASFAKKFDVKDFKLKNSRVQGVAKLRDELLILFQSRPQPYAPNVILVFEDRNPFRLKWEIEISEIRIIGHVGSSVKENCLYVSDADENCVWKITIETDDQHRTMNKWLIADDWITQNTYLSVINDGVMLMVTDESYKPTLLIYGSDAKLSRSIQLPYDIEEPLDAVETSIGNFIIFYQFQDILREISGHSRGELIMKKSGLCELTRDGKMVLSRFTTSNEAQQLSTHCSLFIDSDDRLFVADYENDRVVLLDSDLKWNRILVPTKEGNKEQRMRSPHKLCYDEKKKQLIVGRYGMVTAQVNVYNLNWN